MFHVGWSGLAILRDYASLNNDERLQWLAELNASLVSTCSGIQNKLSVLEAATDAACDTVRDENMELDQAILKNKALD